MYHCGYNSHWIYISILSEPIDNNPCQYYTRIMTGNGKLAVKLASVWVHKGAVVLLWCWAVLLLCCVVLLLWCWDVELLCCGVVILLCCCVFLLLWCWDVELLCCLTDVVLCC